VKTKAIDEQSILDVLRQVIDPELDCNVVDLGLIYSVQIEAAKISVTMTLTTPGCPMHESIAKGVRNALLNVADVEEVNVSLVWEPPWTTDRLSADARQRLGLR
jgi:metal-sulfur cluster biosynthetic enzyme